MKTNNYQLLERKAKINFLRGIINGKRSTKELKNITSFQRSNLVFVKEDEYYSCTELNLKLNEPDFKTFLKEYPETQVIIIDWSQPKNNIRGF